MIILTGEDQSPIAFLYNNILANPDGKVIGVLLGHCIFGKDGQVIAKYFRHTLFTLDGLILAKQGQANNTFKLKIEILIKDAWVLITSIKDHTCPVIDPTNEWATVSLVTYFETPVIFS